MKMSSLSPNCHINVSTSGDKTCKWSMVSCEWQFQTMLKRGKKKHNVNAVFVLHSVHHTAPVGPDLMVHKV